MSDEEIMARIAAIGGDSDTHEEVVEATPTEEATAPVVAEETPRVYAGKYETPEALESAYEHAQRLMHEATQRASDYEQQLAEFQNQPQTPVIPLVTSPTTMEELQALAYDQPEAAVEFAALNAPHAMPHVLAAVRQYDPVRAEVLSDWHSDYKMEQRLAAATQPLQNMQNQATAQQVWQGIAAKPGYAELREDIAAVVAEKAHWFQTQDPQQLAQAMNDAYQIASSRNPGKVAEVAAAAGEARGVAAGAHAETGGHGTREAEQEVSPSQEIHDSIFAKAKSLTW